MSSFTTFSSADEFSPLQPIFPNLSPSEELSVLIARIAELNRAKTTEPSVASSEAFGQDGYAIFPNLSPSEEMSVLIARITELYRAKTIEPSVASSEVFGQDGYGMNDDEFSLDEEEEQQEGSKTPTKDVSEDHLKAILERIGELEKQQQQQTKAGEKNRLQLENVQKKLLEKISELEKQQKEQSKATADQFSKILEKITELEKEQKQKKKALFYFGQNYWDVNACHKNLQISGEKNLIVHYKADDCGWCSVFAEHPILLNNNFSDVFYYEISIKKVEYSDVRLGFAVKQQKYFDETVVYGISYSYASDGWVSIAGTKIERNYEYSYGEGDTVGIGISSATRHVIFTKNGTCLAFERLTDLIVDPTYDNSFHPFISLSDIGDQIEANFGPNFKFDLASL